jgi:hypothetical protein
VKLSQVQFVKAPRERVFAALTDPAVLRACIDGCESLVEVAPDVFEATLKVGFAAIKGAYKGRVEIRDRRPPESLTLSIEGKGLPGFVRASSSVRLLDKDGGTELAGEGEASVGGLIAAVGSRLVESTAKKMLAEFLRKFADRLER